MEKMSDQDDVKRRRAASTLDMTKDCHTSVVLEPRFNQLLTTDMTLHWTAPTEGIYSTLQ